jgi:ElaA protein
VVEAPVVRRAPWAELAPVTAYRLLQLRAAVFVVEQACPYLDPDGRDLEPDARHYWTGDVDAALRLLVEPDGSRRIGRVVTHPDARGRGLAAALMHAAIGDADGQPIVLDAQSHLTAWYTSFGFAVDGADFLEDGIPHTPMRRS